VSRARNIKPGFFKNEELASLPFEFRILFQGLWCLADREGRLEDRPKRIKAEVFPYDPVDVDAGLLALADGGFIVRYANEGIQYIQVLAFAKHQNPHCKEAASTIPAPCKPGASTKNSGTSRADSLIPDSGFSDSGTGPAQAPPARDPLAGVDAQVAKDFTAMRKALKAPITETAVSGIKREADKLGLSLDSALRICVERNWRGFKAEWMHKDGPAPARVRRDL